MKNLKYPDEFYKVIRQFLQDCPVCPKIVAVGNPPLKHPTCNIYRTSDTSVTMQCNQCGLHFTITWKSLAEAIGRNADVLADKEQYEKEYAYYATAFEVLQQNVDIAGIIRNIKYSSKEEVAK